MATPLVDEACAVVFELPCQTNITVAIRPLFDPTEFRLRHDA